MTMVLILAMAVSYGIGSYIEGAVVTFVILLNVIVGFFQEYSAEKTMDSLRSLSSPTARAIRDGESVVLPSGDLVPGDLVELKVGDTIPADVRVFEAVNFETDEALLTGESLPVRKSETVTFPEKTGPGDRLNVAYSSSNVTKGRAKGMSSPQESTRKLVPSRRSFGRRRLGVAPSSARRRLRETPSLSRGVHADPNGCHWPILGPANEFSSEQEVIIYAVATGLSMIPASLVVVLTITMAAGTKRMVKRNVIVRNLKSLEALGAVTDICSDKTGTLTQGKMVARGAWLPGKGTYTVENSTAPFDPTAGDIRHHPESPRRIDFKSGGDACGTIAKAEDLVKDSQNSLGDFLQVASLANLATVTQKEDRWDARGDPTEIAIQVFSTRFGWNRHERTAGEKAEWQDVAELPFDSDVKRMSVVMKHNGTGQLHAYTKGAVERVIQICTKYAPSDDGQLVPVTDEFREDILRNMELVECDLVFRGLIGLYDPPRPESAPAVRQCHEAGISVHMLTGDHPETAKAIAIEFDGLSDEEVDRLPVLPLVVARCAPSTKVRMIEALHRRKRFVAMTGDGVNDSPSLRRADVGIAMGQSGSDVAKRPSKRAAVSLTTFRSLSFHVLSENVAQAGTLLVGLAFKDGRGLSVFPLAPVQIIWIIMATSGMPDMGLGFERAVPDILRRPPQSLKSGVFTAEFLVDMVVYGLWITALCLASFSLVVFGFGNGDLGEFCNEDYSERCDVVFRARATTFACLTWFALFLAWEMIDMRRSFFRMQPGSKKYFTQWMLDVWRNQFLFWAIILGFVTLFPLLYIPKLNTVIFKHSPISWEWGIVFIAAGLFFAGVETWKWGKRVYFRRQDRKRLGPAFKDMDIEQRVFGEFLGSETDEEAAQGGKAQ
ncbi:sodium transport ATPase [Verticillium alfalfae VaMs.102]|uniref:Sodium transport ATPase n=1 Tax=Verticillium alfalfae (strain VaMs.102 / ATCC MYA-4576 / FGSC 10136) TaxID=526221 RepID=C9SG37_VERA1|nr:sodium transport ATPase [Verticillium alfalfae VaMs.102]EEY17441.1 sodium transport ATPase [Verticillium alfalfae VaMs.102]